jgi:hypothetical protein
LTWEVQRGILREATRLFQIQFVAAALLWPVNNCKLRYHRSKVYHAFTALFIYFAEVIYCPQKPGHISEARKKIFEALSINEQQQQQRFKKHL